MNALKTAFVIAASLSLAACQGKTSAKMDTQSAPGADNPTVPNTGGPGGGGPGDPGGPGNTAHCTAGRAYAGFGNIDLTADRTQTDVGLDRDLLKPYGALVGEYPRVLGNTPSLLPAMGPTFSDPGPRWFEVQKSNAVSAFSAFRVAFQGCLTITATDPAYAASPNGNTAPAACTAWQTAFWSRTPSNDETAACAEFAVMKTTTETNPRRQWAYTCAAVMSAAQFLGY